MRVSALKYFKILIQLSQKHHISKRKKESGKTILKLIKNHVYYQKS